MIPNNKHSAAIMRLLKAEIKRYQDICFQMHDYPPQLDETHDQLEDTLSRQITMIKMSCTELGLAIEKELLDFKADLLGDNIERD